MSEFRTKVLYLDGFSPGPGETIKRSELDPIIFLNPFVLCLFSVKIYIRSSESNWIRWQYSNRPSCYALWPYGSFKKSMGASFDHGGMLLFVLYRAITFFDVRVF